MCIRDRSVTESGLMDSMQVSKTVQAQELLLDEGADGQESPGIASDEQYLSGAAPVEHQSSVSSISGSGVAEETVAALPELVIEAMEVETLPQDGTPADKTTCGTAFQDGETGESGMSKNGEAGEYGTSSNGQAGESGMLPNGQAGESGTSQTGADGEKDELVTEGAENETTSPLQTESETQSVHQPEEEKHPSDQTESEGPDKSEEKNKVNLGIDNRHVYPGMEQSFSEGYQPVIKDSILYLAIPFTASGKLKDDCLTVDLVFAEKDNAPFVFKNYQKDVIRKS